MQFKNFKKFSNEASVKIANDCWLARDICQTSPPPAERGALRRESEPSTEYRSMGSVCLIRHTLVLGIILACYGSEVGIVSS